MAQADYSISNASFPATRADINSHLQAIATNNSGTSAPSTQYAGQFWLNTSSSNWQLFMHDGADDILFATIDTSANTVNFTDSALDVVTDTTPQLGGNLDLNSNDITGTGNINITGNLTSTGIDDNATSTAIQINSNEQVILYGQQIQANNNTSNITYSGGNNSNAGANLTLFGGSHASNANVARFRSSATEVMRIDSSGNVGIGTSSPENNLHIFTNNGGEGIIIKSTGNTSNLIVSDANRSGSGSNIVQLLGRWNGTDVADILFNTGSDTTNKDDGIITFRTSTANNISERMRVNHFGEFMVGMTSASISNTGFYVTASGNVGIIRSGSTPLIVNRQTNDGTVISIRQDGTEEGGIDVTGSTVTFNGFTGTHWSRFTDNSKPTILRGTVLESLDEMCDWYNLEFDITTTKQDEDGNDITNTIPQKIPHVLTNTQSNGDVITYNHEGTDYQATIVKESDIKHMKSKVSDTVDAKNVYGVFNSWDEDGEGYNDFYVASVGSFVVRIKANETIAKGDLLQSNGDGTAKVQTDDAVRSSSFAKVLSTTIIETYDDGSYLVPCSLMC